MFPYMKTLINQIIYIVSVLHCFDSLDIFGNKEKFLSNEIHFTTKKGFQNNFPS